MQHALHQHEMIIVGVPVYNEENYIQATLRSIQQQSCCDFLCVISDNASTDRTSEICKVFCNSDKRFIYIRQEENVGAAENFNYLFEYSESKYFMWLGAHDLIHRDLLKKHIDFLEDNPNYVLSYSSTQWIDEYGKETRVTDAGRFDIYNHLSPWKRYFKFVKFSGECTAVNHVIRRNALQGFRLVPVKGCDNILLSRLFFKGLWNRFDEPYYLRREWIYKRIDPLKKEQERMNKITPHYEKTDINYSSFKNWFKDILKLETNYLKRSYFFLKFLYLFYKRFVLEQKVYVCKSRMCDSETKIAAFRICFLSVVTSPDILFLLPAKTVKYILKKYF